MEKKTRMVANRFRYAGQQYYLCARFYNPVVGRFTQGDAAGKAYATRMNQSKKGEG